MAAFLSTCYWLVSKSVGFLTTEKEGMRSTVHWGCRSPPAVSDQCSFVLQYLVCKRKLESKKEALLILSKELDTCQQERDQYKLMANQLRERHQSLKKKYRELIVSLTLERQLVPSLKMGKRDVTMCSLQK